MSSRTRALTSSVGGKLLIGATGLGLFLYLVIHVSANATVFLGPLGCLAIVNFRKDRAVVQLVQPVVRHGIIERR